MSQFVFPTGFNRHNIVGIGTFGFVLRREGSPSVIKCGLIQPEPAIANERKIYERFEEHGGHDGILRYLGPYGTGICLEYASNGSLREYLEAQDAPAELRSRWCRQVTAALHFIHSKNVIHGDLQCHNILVDAHLDAKVADFGGSSLGTSGLLGVVTASHRYPGELLSRLADIFALGSTMYEIVSGQRPYNGREDKEIMDMFQQGRFPPTEDFGRIGGIISNCWHGRYRDAEQVLKDIDAAQPRSIDPIGIILSPVALSAVVLLTVFGVRRLRGAS